MAARTETGPMPSISHSSSPSVVPRRRAAASMMTSVSALAVDPPPPRLIRPRGPRPRPTLPRCRSGRPSGGPLRSRPPRRRPPSSAPWPRPRAPGPPGPRRSRRRRTRPGCRRSRLGASESAAGVCTRARRTRSVSRLLLAARSLAAVSETSCCEAPCPIRSSKDSVASGTSVAVLTTTPSWSGESSDSWSASVSRGSAAARSAAARRPLALAAEVPESEPSHSWAEPWPPLANEPVSTTRGVNSATPEAAARSISAKEATMLRAWFPETEQRLGLTHQLLEVAEECIDFVAECRVSGSRVSGSRVVMIGVVLVQGGHVVGEWHVVGGCHERR